MISIQSLIHTDKLIILVKYMKLFNLSMFCNIILSMSNWKKQSNWSTEQVIYESMILLKWANLNYKVIYSSKIITNKIESVSHKGRGPKKERESC
jgi:hypothetical protein